MRSRNEVMTPEATGLKLNDEAPSNAAHWHARAQAAETDARTLRCRYAVVSGWIVEALKVLDTLDPEGTHEADELGKLIKAGEVLALTTLASSKAPEFECLGEPSLCANPRGCACFQAGRTDRPSTPVGWSDTDWLKHLEEIRQNEAAYARGPLPERGWD